MAWFHGVWICSVEVLEYRMISSLKIKLNLAKNYEGIGMCLWCCWKDLDDDYQWVGNIHD